MMDTVVDEVLFQCAVSGIGDVPQGEAVLSGWMTILTRTKRINKTSPFHQSTFIRMKHRGNI